MRNRNAEADFKAELKRVRKLKDYYIYCKNQALKHGNTEEAEIRSLCIKNFEEEEQRMLNILDGIEMQKTGKVYFTKDATCRYRNHTDTTHK